MRKLLFITLVFCFLNVRSNGQSSVAPVQITKAELASFNDIKPILARAYPNKDYTYYGVQAFNITGSTTEDGNSISFSESTICGKLTEKQRLLIEKYSKSGTVFTLDGIIMRERGKPGTPYNPAELTTVAVPNVLFSIKE